MEKQEEVILKRISKKDNIYLLTLDKDLIQMDLYQMDKNGFTKLGPYYDICLNDLLAEILKNIKDSQIVQSMLLDMILKLAEICLKNGLSPLLMQTNLITFHQETNTFGYPLNIKSKIKEKENAFLYIQKQALKHNSQIGENISEFINNLIIYKVDPHREIEQLRYILKQTDYQNKSQSYISMIDIVLKAIREKNKIQYTQSLYYQIIYSCDNIKQLHCGDPQLFYLLQHAYLYKLCLKNVDRAKLVFRVYKKLMIQAIDQDQQLFEDDKADFDFFIFKEYQNSFEENSGSKQSRDTKHESQQQTIYSSSNLFNRNLNQKACSISQMSQSPQTNSNQFFMNDDDNNKQMDQLQSSLTHLQITVNQKSNCAISPSKLQDHQYLTQNDTQTKTSLQLRQKDIFSALKDCDSLIVNFINTLKSSQQLVDGFQVCFCEQKSKQWHKERKQRITASNFGKICKSQQETRDLKAKSLIQPKYFSNQATEYGNENEAQAREQYIELKKNTESSTFQVKEFGLIIDKKYNWIGGSPDGVVYNNNVPVGCIEIKCPFSIKDRKIREAYKQTAFLQLDNNGKVTLKRNHDYYYQCQGIMYLTGMKWCDFIVFTQVDLNIERIPLDQAFVNQMLQELNKFFFNHFIVFYIFPDFSDDEREAIISSNAYQNIISKFNK